LKIPFSISGLCFVGTPSSSKSLLPTPSDACASSIRLKFSAAIFEPSLSEKQLRLSE